jgi:hypothetical protein
MTSWRTAHRRRARAERRSIKRARLDRMTTLQRSLHDLREVFNRFSENTIAQALRNLKFSFEKWGVDLAKNSPVEFTALTTRLADGSIIITEVEPVRATFSGPENFDPVPDARWGFRDKSFLGRTR